MVKASGAVYATSGADRKLLGFGHTGRRAIGLLGSALIAGHLAEPTYLGEGLQDAAGAE